MRTLFLYSPAMHSSRIASQDREYESTYWLADCSVLLLSLSNHNYLAPLLDYSQLVRLSPPNLLPITPY